MDEAQVLFMDAYCMALVLPVDESTPPVRTLFARWLPAVEAVPGAQSRHAYYSLSSTRVSSVRLWTGGSGQCREVTTIDSGDGPSGPDPRLAQPHVLMTPIAPTEFAKVVRSWE
jgi:hypothetical protein